jgi:thiol:disulfide interchange protein DsbA
VFESGWDMLAKAYYTAHDLGIEAKMMPVLFKAIQDQNQDLSTEDAIEKLFVAQGVSKQSFESTFDFSPGIDAQMMRGDNLMRTYGVYEIPTIVVDGKYKTNVGMSGGDDKRFIQVVNYLIAKARQGGN